MLIWLLLFYIGLGLPVLGIFGIVIGMQKKSRLVWVASLLVPVLYWLAFWMLWEADRRFIEEETKKNGGVTPDWVW